MEFTGNPSRANRMAGSMTVSRGRVPNSPCRRTKPATAPGTPMTAYPYSAWGAVSGIVGCRSLGGGVDPPDLPVRKANKDLGPPPDAVHGGLHNRDGEGSGHRRVRGVPTRFEHLNTRPGGQRLRRRNHPMARVVHLELEGRRLLRSDQVRGGGQPKRGQEKTVEAWWKADRAFNSPGRDWIQKEMNVHLTGPSGQAPLLQKKTGPEHFRIPMSLAERSAVTSLRCSPPP